MERKLENEQQIASHILKTLGEKIKAIRLKKGIRQNEIANRCNFNKSNYNSIEAEKRNITILKLNKIALALDEPAERFIKPEVKPHSTQ